MALLSLEGVSKSIDDRVLLRDVTLMLGEGERVGLVGPNGGGKTTLMRILAGVEPPDLGQRVVRRDLRLGYLEQDPVLDGAATVREFVRAGLPRRERVLSELERLHQAMEAAAGEDLGRLMARQARVEHELELLGGHDVEHEVEATLSALGLERADERCDALSGGERRRAAIARLLLAAPELLLLDEPTNHLDAFVTDWLEDWFLDSRTPLLLVTHDRYFLDRVCDRIVELDRGSLFGYPGGYAEYLEARAERLETERKTESARLNLLRRETAWMRRGAPARTTKAKARIKRFHATEAAAPIELAAELELEFPVGPRLGSRVATLHGVSKRYGVRVVVPTLDLELAPGMRLGIVGPNGAGKSTLIKLLLGELAPDTGRRAVGETVRFASIDQLRSTLDPRRSVREELAGPSDVVSVGGRTVRAESFLDRFGFDAAQQRSQVGQLSGGERNRLMLAKLLCQGGNVLVLDEPTNDLDLFTLRALEEALLAFPGTAVVVSHDRWFLDRVATEILCLDGRGGARRHIGDVSSLLDELAREREASKNARPQSKPASAAPKAAPTKKRITPWQERELEQLERAIPAAEAEIAELDERLADPRVWSGPVPAAAELQKQRAALALELARRYARWEELESLR
jgi:ATP-binding cassette subfamily F protein uup